MKNIKLIIILLLTIALITSCVKDDDFDAPDLTIIEPNIENVISIETAASLLVQAQQSFGFETIDDLFSANFVTPLIFEETNSYITGYVISSDEGGNYFEEIIIQDKLENPTMGVNIQVDVNPLFTKFELGRKVFIRLDGLTIGISSGVLTIGMSDSDNDVEKIPESQLNEFFIKSSEIGTIVPLPVSLNSISSSMTNLFITIEDAQFNRHEVLGTSPLTFAAEPLDEFNGERTLESCDGGSIVFSTSTFADFKSLTLPLNRGAIQGVLTKNFFGDEFNLVINFPSDINFDNDLRCDPIELNCGIADTEGSTNIFTDNFETQNVGTPISGNGWTNYIETGTVSWQAFSASSGSVSYNNSISATIGSFGSNDANSVAWLITPEIDLDAQDNETFTFKTSNSFADNSKLELLFSTDWDGIEANITNATWGIIPAAYIVQDDDFFVAWFDSGIVDLSCGEGSIHIAFKYIGGDVDNEFNGTYELDEINIKF